MYDHLNITVLAVSSMLFKDALNCQGYVVSIVNECIGTES